MNRIKLLTLIFIFVFIASGCSNHKIDKTQINKDYKNNNSIIDVELSNNKDSNKSDNINYYPLVYNGVLLGGYGNGLWHSSSEIYLELNGEEKYKIYTFDTLIGEGKGNKPMFQDSPPPDLINIDIDYQEEYLNGDYVALTSDWNAIPRIPKIQNNEIETYKEIVKEILQNNGIDKNIPINIKQNIKVDLEGDGVDEVIIMAENVSPLAGYLQNNSYSILFIRKTIDSEAKNIFIAKDIVVTDEEYIESVAMSYNIKSIIDANGDGVMELLIESAYYEGVGYSLYEIKNDDIKLLLSNEDGV